MTGSLAFSGQGYGKQRDEGFLEIASALAEACAPTAFATTSRMLIVEPRSAHIAQSLRAAGFSGELVAMASVHIGERYGVAGGYSTVIVDDWTARILPAGGEPRPAETELGLFQSIVVTDLTRYLAVDRVANALRWLAGRLAIHGCLALADPALTLNTERLTEALIEMGLTPAGGARIIEGDWPRTLTLWRHWSPAYPATRQGEEEALILHTPQERSTQAEPHTASSAPYTLNAPSLEGKDGRAEPAVSLAEDLFPFRRERVLARAGRLQFKAREGSRLTVIVARESDLLPEERTAISRYRLEQYMHVNLYSASLIEEWGIQEDPGMDLLTPNDVHFLTATEDGVIAAYLCLQNASSLLATRATQIISPGVPLPQATLAPEQPLTNAPTLGDANRPIFPVETKHGDLFSAHPAFRTLPVSSVREITRLVRNQRPDMRGRLRDIADIAIAETIVASAHYVNDPANRVEAIIGCMALEARRALLNYRIPVAYAPDAPLLGENLSGSDAGGRVLWTDESREEGFFWPFAISVLDVRCDVDYFASLEEALNRPSTREVRESVNALRKRTPLRASRFAASFTYAGYREGASHRGFTRIMLPVEWAGLEAPTRPV